MIIASLTTIPKRVETLPRVIEAILNQSYPVDELHLNVPYICKRTAEEYDLSLFKVEDSRVKLFRTPDYGAITKVAPTLLRISGNTDDYVFSLDDDFAYPRDTLQKLMHVSSDHPRIITRYGGALSDTGDFNNWFGSGRANFLEGFGGVLYPSNIIKKDLLKLLEYVSSDGDLIRSDDIVLSTYFNYHNIEIYLHNPITSDDDYDIEGKLDTESVDALRLDSYDDRRSMYRRAYNKTRSFLDTFWENSP